MTAPAEELPCPLPCRADAAGRACRGLSGMPSWQPTCVLCPCADSRCCCAFVLPPAPRHTQTRYVRTTTSKHPHTCTPHAHNSATTLPWPSCPFRLQVVQRMQGAVPQGAPAAAGPAACLHGPLLTHLAMCQEEPHAGLPGLSSPALYVRACRTGFMFVSPCSAVLAHMVVACICCHLASHTV